MKVERLEWNTGWDFLVALRKIKVNSQNWQVFTWSTNYNEFTADKHLFTCSNDKKENWRKTYMNIFAPKHKWNKFIKGKLMINLWSNAQMVYAKVIYTEIKKD